MQALDRPPRLHPLQSVLGYDCYRKPVRHYCARLLELLRLDVRALRRRVYREFHGDGCHLLLIIDRLLLQVPRTHSRAT